MVQAHKRVTRRRSWTDFLRVVLRNVCRDGSPEKVYPKFARRQVVAREDAVAVGGAAPARLHGVRRRESAARRPARGSRRWDAGAPVRGPSRAGGSPELTSVRARRYECQDCGACMVVVPRELLPRRLYTASAIGFALALWALLGTTEATGARPRESDGVCGGSRGG